MRTAQSVTSVCEDGFISAGLQEIQCLCPEEWLTEDFRLHERPAAEVVWEGFPIPLRSHYLLHPWRVHLSFQSASKLLSWEIPSPHSPSSVLVHRVHLPAPCPPCQHDQTCEICPHWLCVGLCQLPPLRDKRWPCRTACLWSIVKRAVTSSDHHDAFCLHLTRLEGWWSEGGLLKFKESLCNCPWPQNIHHVNDLSSPVGPGLLVPALLFLTSATS